VYYNGYVSYTDGLKNIQKANKEDYSVVIPMYPVSHHSNASSATSNMDMTIEKCRKAIKLHSIKVKPNKNYKKANLPEYKLFYNQQEFNPALSDAWLLLGKAEFHKGDFLGSVGTFTYIMRHYSTDKNMEAVCQLWIARAYGEMGWTYEAEQIISKIVQDKLNRSNIGLYASVNADLLLKKHQFKEAIPFLELALSKENDRNLQQRFSYILAQIYRLTNDDKAAYAAYSKVIKSNPTYEMDFNARINRAQLDEGNILNVRKDLNGMLRNLNNKEYLDQIYFALGNTYLHHNDTTKAIENYKLSAEKSSRKGVDKATTLITLGDIYYGNRNYVLAQPCYEEAGKIITKENEDFFRITKRATLLNDLVTQNNIVVLQDSLLRLSAMTERQREEVVKKLIAKLIADEKATADKALKDKQIASFDDNNGPMQLIGNGTPGQQGDWYFYNIDIVRNGESQFAKKWGNRKLEDNWRRTNKATSLFADDNLKQTAAKDSTDTISKSKELTDNKKPEFYLRQIPVTPSQLAKSTAEIKAALFNMGLVYKDKIEDIPMAISTFEEFVRRFPSDNLIADASYYLYLMYTKNGDTSQADLYRNKIISEFPGTKYQKILSQPDYTERLEHMYLEQDSIYNITYKAFNESDFGKVYKQVAFIKQNYPLSPLMPKFLFLNALSIGKKESQEKFKNALTDLVTTYPESDVSAMAKDILALIKQGQETKNGTSSGSLLSRRDENTKNEINELVPQQFSTDRLSKHRLMLIGTIDREKMNKLLYNIASFNFSRFMIKDFDLVISKLDSVQSVLSITNFETFDEVSWYVNSLSMDAQLTGLLNEYQLQKVIISEDNYVLIRTTFNLGDYLAFQSKPIVKNKNVQVAENKTTKKVETTVALKNKTTKVQPELQPKPDTKQIEKSAQIVENKTESKQPDNNPTKPTQKPTIQKMDSVKKVEPIAPVVVVPKQPEVPLFKGLYGYIANEPHFIAIYIVSGTIDFVKTKAALDTYNSQNYGIMNLKVSLETVGKQQVIIIGSLTNASVAKSYLLRMVKEKSLFEGLKGSTYRNLLGSKKNLNVAIQQNKLDIYFEFMQEYYLK
jgi:tetratricopeptide (TPR) repeat protein